MQHKIKLELDQQRSTNRGNVLTEFAKRSSRPENTLLDTLALQASVIEHFPGGLCAFDKNLNMTVCNEQLKRLLGYPTELFANGYPTIEQLFRFKAKRGEYGPGDIEQHVRSRMRLVAQGQSHRYERQLVDGTIIEVRGRPLEGGGFVTSYLDVTEQRKYTKKMEALIDSYPSGIAVFDKDLEMILCNDLLRSRIPRSEELFSSGLPSLEQYVWHNAKYGEYGQGSIAQIASKRLKSIRLGEFLQHDVVVGRKQHIAVKCVPTKQGGYVETQVDVTIERVRTGQLEKVLRFFPGGVAMFDRSLKPVLHNEQFKQLLGLPDELLESPSTTLESLVYYNAKKGELGAGNIDDLVSNRLNLLRESQPHMLDRSTSEGIDLEINSVPLDDGGLLTTYIDVTDKNKMRDESIKLANYSPVTGLPNRVLFRDRLDIALAQAERGTSMALLYLDIHDFKRINELYGQRVGDEILSILGSRFIEHKRDTDTYAHLGGDLFAVIQVGIHDSFGAEVLVKRILRIVREPIEINGDIFELDACIGVALAPDDGTFADIIDTKASTALYAAKDIGAGMFMFIHSCTNNAML